MSISSLFAGIWMTIASWFGGPSAPIAPVATTTVPQIVSSSTASVPLSSTVSVPRSPIASLADYYAHLGSDMYASGALPLGDQHYSLTGPKKGYVYLCNTVSGGQGAQHAGPWITGSTWNDANKTVVEGKNSWPNAYFKATVANGTRTIGPDPEFHTPILV